MKNIKSKYLIIAISIAVALVHVVKGPNFDGPLKIFVNSYLIDILLPMSMYLLLQVALRKITKVGVSRILAGISVLSFGVFVEVLQLNRIDFLGSTYDKWDFLMYGIGVILGILIDYLIIDKLESSTKS